MTIPRIEDLIGALISPYQGSLRGHLAGIDATDGTVQSEDFHSLLSWPGKEGRFHMVYNDAAAVLFLDRDLRGVARFERSLLAEANPEPKFTKIIHQALATGAL